MPIRRPDHGCHGYSSSQNSVPWAFSSLVVQHDQAPASIPDHSAGADHRPFLLELAQKITASVGRTVINNDHFEVVGKLFRDRFGFPHERPDSAFVVVAGEENGERWFHVVCVFFCIKLFASSSASTEPMSNQSFLRFTARSVPASTYLLLTYVISYSPRSEVGWSTILSNTVLSYTYTPVTARFDFGAAGFSSISTTRPSLSIVATPKRCGSLTSLRKTSAPPSKFCICALRSSSKILSPRYSTQSSCPT